MTKPLDAMTQAMTPKRAISYIRVSTREQAARGGTLEGFSIPAQRDAKKKKAASIGALIVKEFVDRGESARSAKRLELQKNAHLHPRTRLHRLRHRPQTRPPRP